MKPAADTDLAATVTGHMTALAGDIGPRGTGTPEERRAADYAHAELRRLADARPGARAGLDRFPCPVSGWQPYALAASGALLAEGLLVWGGRVGAAAAAILLAALTAWTVLELSFHATPLRRLTPRGESANAWLELPAADATQAAGRQVVILTGHLDTHRTPWALSSAPALFLYRRLVPLGLLSFVALMVLAVWAAWAAWSPAAWPPASWLKPASLVPAGILAAVAAVAWQADGTPWTAGANDNASGAAVVLALAARAAEQPLRRMELRFVCTGAEETGNHGVADYLDRHSPDSPDAPDAGAGAVHICIDNVAGRGAGPCYLRRETMLRTWKADPGLLDVADRTARAHPELGACCHARFRGAYTEGAESARRGMRAITFLGLTPGGVLPDWHRVTDTLDRADPQVAARTAEFVWRFLQDLDAQVDAQVERS